MKHSYRRVSGLENWWSYEKAKKELSKNNSFDYFSYTEGLTVKWNVPAGVQLDMDSIIFLSV